MSTLALKQLQKCSRLHSTYCACNRPTTVKLHCIQNDEEVLDKLSDLVADPPDPEMELLSAQGCTGMHCEARHPSHSTKVQAAAHILLMTNPIIACVGFANMVTPCSALHQMLIL